MQKNDQTVKQWTPPLKFSHKNILSQPNIQKLRIAFLTITRSTKLVRLSENCNCRIKKYFTGKPLAISWRFVSRPRCHVTCRCKANKQLITVDHSFYRFNLGDRAVYAKPRHWQWNQLFAMSSFCVIEWRQNCCRFQLTAALPSSVPAQSKNLIKLFQSTWKWFAR